MSPFSWYFPDQVFDLGLTRGVVIAYSTHNRENPGSHPGRSVKSFLTPLAPVHLAVNGYKTQTGILWPLSGHPFQWSDSLLAAELVVVPSFHYRRETLLIYQLNISPSHVWMLKDSPCPPRRCKKSNNNNWTSWFTSAYSCKSSIQNDIDTAYIKQSRYKLLCLTSLMQKN